MDTHRGRSAQPDQQADHDERQQRRPDPEASLLGPRQVVVDRDDVGGVPGDARLPETVAQLPDLLAGGRDESLGCVRCPGDETGCGRPHQRPLFFLRRGQNLVDGVGVGAVPEQHQLSRRMQGRQLELGFDELPLRAPPVVHRS